MKKIWCLMLAVSLVFLMTACQQEEMIQKETEQERRLRYRKTRLRKQNRPSKKTTCLDKRNRPGAGDQRNG